MYSTLLYSTVLTYSTLTIKGPGKRRKKKKKDTLLPPQQAPVWNILYYLSLIVIYHDYTRFLVIERPQLLPVYPMSLYVS